MKTPILFLALSGCAYGVEYRPGAREATYCITAKDATGAPSYHPCDPSDPWISASSGLTCAESPIIVGDSCYYHGQIGVAE